MPDVIQQVKIIATFQSNLSGMNKAINTLDKLKASHQLTNKEYKNAMELLKNSSPEYFKISKSMKNHEDRQNRINKAQTDAIKGSRKMTSAYLGLMFTAMAVSRVFGGLVKQVLDVLGVGDMLSATILIVLLPALQPLADILFAVMDFFMNLPEGVQLAIGIFVILTAVVSALTVIVMMAIIAISAIATALGIGFGAAAAVIGLIIAAIAAVIVGLGLIIYGVVLIVKGHLEGIGLVIMGIGVILLLFIGWWALIPIAVGAAVYLIIKHWDTIKGWFIAFGDWIAGLFSKIWEGIKAGVTIFVNFFKDIWEGVKTVFKAVINFFISGINLWIGGFESMINFAIKGLNTLIKLINKIPGINIGEIGGISLPRIPTFQAGGVMPYTGLAMLHKGETITPAGQNINNSPVFNITANVASDYDVRRLADQLSKYWTSDFERISKSRGMI